MRSLQSATASRWSTRTKVCEQRRGELRWQPHARTRCLPRSWPHPPDLPPHPHRSAVQAAVDFEFKLFSTTRALADHFGLHYVHDLEQIMESLARNRAKACVDALISLGVGLAAVGDIQFQSIGFLMLLLLPGILRKNCKN